MRGGGTRGRVLLCSRGKGNKGKGGGSKDGGGRVMGKNTRKCSEKERKVHKAA